MDFEKLRQYLDSLPERYSLSVYGCAIHLDGKAVFRAGNDLSSGRDFFRLYSATKPLTGFCAMQLIEQGRLGLFDRVSDYLPAFAHLSVQHGKIIEATKTPLQIHHLLSMSGGFDYDDEFPQMRALLDGREQVRCEEAVSVLAQRPLHFEPGTHYLYGLGLDILGAVIEKISGMTLDAYMARYLFRPIGSRELTFFPTEAQYARMEPQRYFSRSGPKKENFFLHARHFPSGGCGLCGTVDDYMRFLDMLANTGTTASGEQLLGQEAMNLFRTPLLQDHAQEELLNGRIEPELQGLGVRVRPIAPLKGMYTGDGAAGAYCFASRESRVSLLFATHLINASELYTTVHPTIFRLACTALGDNIIDNIAPYRGNSTA